MTTHQFITSTMSILSGELASSSHALARENATSTALQTEQIRSALEESTRAITITLREHSSAIQNQMRNLMQVSARHLGLDLSTNLLSILATCRPDQLCMIGCALALTYTSGSSQRTYQITTLLNTIALLLCAALILPRSVAGAPCNVVTLIDLLGTRIELDIVQFCQSSEVRDSCSFVHLLTDLISMLVAPQRTSIHL